jgi:hypothetical protein
MASVWELHDEIQNKIIEKNIYGYNATTLKHIHRMLDYLEELADRHYIDCIERDDDTIAGQIDCKCSEKRLTSMKRRIVRYYEALLRGELVDY